MTVAEMRQRTKSKAIKSATAAALILSLSGTASTAKAEQILIYFSGEVFLVTDMFCQCIDDVDIGSPISGYYIYDSSTPDEEPSPYIGWYVHSAPPNGIELYVGLHRYASDPGNIDFLMALNDSLTDEHGTYDLFRIVEGNPLDFSRYTPVISINLYLRDNTATALLDDSLPIDAPNLDDWPTRRWIHIMGYGFEIGADITSFTKGALTGIGSKYQANAPGLTVLPNAPNPFSNETRLNFVLPTPSEVMIDIFDVTGRRVFAKKLHELPLGLNSYFYDGQSKDGQLLPSGVYFYRVKAGTYSATKKMVILR